MTVIEAPGIRGPRTLAGRRIELWVEARDGAPAVNPVMRALLDELAAAGAVIRVRVPEADVVDADLLPGHGRVPDLVLLKSATALALSLAVADEASGGRFLNPATTTLRVHDKAATVARLAAAGLPVPATFLCQTGRNAGRMPPPPESHGAWVSKPTRGVHGVGVAVHGAFPTSLEEPPPGGPPGGYVLDDGTRLVQRRIGADEPDLKAYVAGEAVFAGVKRFSRTSYAADDVAPRTLTAAERALVVAAGEALGLRLFGVDLRAEAGAPAIVDLNPFPGYRGFPEAVPALRREVERALREAGR